MNAAEHLESHLGPMEVGWSSSSLPGVQICLFRDRPVAGVITLTTLGLSNTVLAMSTDRRVRQELLIATPDDRAPEEFGKLLLHIAERLQKRGQALLRGDVVPLGDKLTVDSAADALYASMPVVFPEGLATLADSSPPTVFVWLIPLLPSEVTFVESSGWNEFEDRLEAVDPDVFDLCRDSVV
jgi:Suppressor of fused protein (SUFU)